MPKRRCLDCSTLCDGSRCPPCTRTRKQARNKVQGQRYDAAWTAYSRETRAQHVALHGWLCPGWDTPPHQSTDLVVDHDVGVLCRKCNSSKAGGYDKQR